MAAKDKQALNINIKPEIISAVDRYQHKKMMKTRTLAIEHLLEFALKQNPPGPDQSQEKR